MFNAFDFLWWYTVYQQSQRWIAAGVFEAIVADLRTLLRLVEGRSVEPSTMIIDSRRVQSTATRGAFTNIGVPFTLNPDGIRLLPYRELFSGSPLRELDRYGAPDRRTLGIDQADIVKRRSFNSVHP